MKESISVGKSKNVDFLLAISSSVIDTAKAITYGLAKPEKDVWKLFDHTHMAKNVFQLPVYYLLLLQEARPRRDA